MNGNERLGVYQPIMAQDGKMAKTSDGALYSVSERGQYRKLGYGPQHRLVPRVSNKTRQMREALVEANDRAREKNEAKHGGQRK